MSTESLGALWIGPRLNQIEAACIRSMQAHGHQVTLFTDGPVGNVPDGVRMANYRDITGDRPILRYRESNHPALFANIFRYHMLALGGLAWVDLDIFLLRPLQPVCGYLIGRQNADVISNAILGLPTDSPALRDLIRLCDQPSPIPPFFKPARRARMRLRRAIGFGTPLTDLPWGTSGPQALTHFLTQSGEARHAAPPDIYYPIAWENWRTLLAPAEIGWSRLSPETRAVHFYNKFLRAELGDEPPPPDSFLAALIGSV